MGRSDASLVTLLYRRHSAEHSMSPEKTWGCPIEHDFSGRKNDCLQNTVRDLVWNASCNLGRARGNWPLTIGSGLDVPS